MSREIETEPEAGSNSDSEPRADDRDERLGEAIEDYLALAEAGTPPDPDVFARRYPDLGEDLKSALDGLAMIQGLVGSSGAGPGSRLEAGRRVAGYRIVRELGRGGMGIVYEAVHVDLDRPVALKVLGMHAAPDSTGRRRFLNEAKTAAGLHHTHIVPVFDVGQVGGLCYYAMQRIEGCGLDRVIKALRKGRSSAAGSGSHRPATNNNGHAEPLDLLSGTSVGDSLKSWVSGVSLKALGVSREERHDEAPPFEPPRGSEYYRWVARAGSQAADALSHAHRRGVIHRDVKPSNILVDARGTVWVADFGLARRLADPAMTQTDSLLGTPRYMSPEQSELGPVDGRTDVYSLGTTLYELLTLRPPFEGKTAAELVVQIRDREPLPPRKIDPKLPRDLETIILKAMAKRPADRYANATELAEDLNRFLATEPVRARRIGPVGRTWRFVRRHPSLTAVSTIATVAILTTATVAYARVVQERNKALSAQKDTEKALDGEKIARRELKGLTVQGLTREAKLARLMRTPDFRKTGLARLKEAVALRPDTAMIPQLRDEAVQLMALRDIEPRPPIASGQADRVVFVGSDGRMATLSSDGAELSVWDLARHERTARHALSDGPGDEPFPPKFGPPRLGLAAAGSKLAVTRPGVGVRFFDEESGTFTDLKTPGRRASNLVLTTDGRRLVIVEDTRTGGRGGGNGGGGPGNRPSGEAYRVTLWDPERRDAPIATLAMPEIKPEVAAATRFFRDRQPLVACSPDGKTIATTWFLDSEITLWDSEEGAKKGSITAEGFVTALALGADGSLAAVCNGTIPRWDIASRKPLPDLKPHQPIIRGIRFSPDGAMLAVIGGSNGVEIWDPDANALLTTVPTTAPVGDLAFSPDGRAIAATVGPETRVWAVVDPIGRSRLSGPETRPPSGLHGMAFGPTGTLATTFWNRTTVTALLQCPEGGIAPRDRLRSLSVGFDPDGRLVIPQGDTLEFYRGPRDPQPERTMPLPDIFGRLLKPGESPRPGDYPMIFNVVASADGRVMGLVRGDPFRADLVLVRFNEADAPPSIGSVAFTSDHRGRDGGRNRPPRMAPGGGGGPGGGPGQAGGPNERGRVGFAPSPWLALSPDGRRLYSVSDQPRIWELEDDRAREAHWSYFHRDVTRLAPSPDGRYVALGYHNGRVAIVDAQDGTPLYTIPAQAESDPVTALAFSRQGQLAIGYRSGGIGLWAAYAGAKPEPLVSLPAHQGEVKALTFAPDGRRLAAGDDSGADIWDLDEVRAQLRAIGLGW